MKLASIILEAEGNAEPGMGQMADQIAKAIEKELRPHKGELDGDTNEVAGVVGIIGYILLSNTVAHMLAKIAKSLSKKYNKPGILKSAEWWEDFTHKNEAAFMAPIKRIVGIFTKDEAKKKGITKILYSIIIFGMAGSAGGSAVQLLKQTKWATAAAYSAKALIKGAEVSTLIKGAVEDLVS